MLNLKNLFESKWPESIYIYHIVNKDVIIAIFYFKISQKDRPEIIKSIKIELLENVNYLNNKEVKTIYFGGGTPSIINEKELEDLIILIYQNFKVKKM